MNYIQTLNLLKTGELNGIYVLNGEEVFLVDTFVELFKEKLVSKDFFDMNYLEVDFSKIDLKKLKTDCETAPFFSNKRLVMVKNCNLTRDGIKNNKEFFEEMYKYIKIIPKTTILVFIMKGKVAFRGKFYKEISVLGHNIELNPLNQNELFSFINKRFKSRNIQVKDSVLNYIIDRIGYLDKSREKNLYDVENEVKKLLDTFESEKKVTKELIDYCLVDKFENSIFKLLDCISKKDFKESIKILTELKFYGEDSFSSFYMIVRYIRNLLGIKSMKMKNKHLDFIVKELGISMYEGKKLYLACDGFSLDKLCDFISYAYEVESNIKTKNTDIDLMLEILISKMVMGGVLLE